MDYFNRGTYSSKYPSDDKQKDTNEVKYMPTIVGGEARSFPKSATSILARVADGWVCLADLRWITKCYTSYISRLASYLFSILLRGLGFPRTLHGFTKRLLRSRHGYWKCTASLSFSYITMDHMYGDTVAFYTRFVFDLRIESSHCLQRRRVFDSLGPMPS